MFQTIMHKVENRQQTEAKVYIIHEGYMAARVVPSHDAIILTAYTIVGRLLVWVTEYPSALSQRLMYNVG